MVKNSIVPQIGMSVVHSLLHTSVIIREHTEGETFFEKKKKDTCPTKHAFTPLQCWLKVMGLPYAYPLPPLLRNLPIDLMHVKSSYNY